MGISEKVHITAKFQKLNLTNTLRYYGVCAFCIKTVITAVKKQIKCQLIFQAAITLTFSKQL